MPGIARDGLSLSVNSELMRELTEGEDGERGWIRWSPIAGKKLRLAHAATGLVVWKRREDERWSVVAEWKGRDPLYAEVRLPEFVDAMVMVPLPKRVT
jgi:hypothetical protein